MKGKLKKTEKTGNLYQELDLWTVEETAERLGLGVKTIRNLIKQGAFPNIKRVGKRYRIPKEDVVEWLKPPIRKINF